MIKDKSSLKQLSNVWFFSGELESLSSTAGSTLGLVYNWRSVVSISNAAEVNYHTND